ncbi:MAG: hypothetical protein K0R94_765 [Burkholderiales bacterium]|nr:hypothetical protein [Burkholderiales bacterium]
MLRAQKLKSQVQEQSMRLRVTGLQKATDKAIKNIIIVYIPIIIHKILERTLTVREGFLIDMKLLLKIYP